MHRETARCKIAFIRREGLVSKKLPVPGELFQADGREAFVIRPSALASGHPWVWYAPTLPQYPDKNEKWMVDKFLASGISVAGVDVGESYGNPEGTRQFSGFYAAMLDRQFCMKPALLARSRGGLMLYNWAVENADKVSCIAGIYPVCCLTSFPGVEKACAAYGVSGEDLAGHEPLSKLDSLAAARVPIYHIHGDDDSVVPIEENSDALARIYESLGGSVTLTIAEGEGHSLWPGFFRDQQLVEFVTEHMRKNCD